MPTVDTSGFNLEWAWETTQQAGKRLGTTDLHNLALWIVEELNAGRAEAAEIRDRGWVVPVFRKRARQRLLFEEAPR